jgi:hypothetical protein
MLRDQVEQAWHKSQAFCQRKEANTESKRALK